MKFKVSRVSATKSLDCLGREVYPCEEATKVNKKLYTIEFNTLEELLQFIEKYDESIISPLFPDVIEKTGCNYEIMIYDDYIE